MRTRLGYPKLAAAQEYLTAFTRALQAPMEKAGRIPIILGLKRLLCVHYRAAVSFCLKA